MRAGDRVECIDELSPFYRHIGRMTGVSREGKIMVQFPSLNEWDVYMDPHDLELASAVVWSWERSPWVDRLDLLKSKHERIHWPDEQELADMGRSS